MLTLLWHLLLLVHHMLRMVYMLLLLRTLLLRNGGTNGEGCWLRSRGWVPGELGDLQTGEFVSPNL